MDFDESIKVTIALLRTDASVTGGFVTLIEKISNLAVDAANSKRKLCSQILSKLKVALEFYSNGIL